MQYAYTARSTSGETATGVLAGESLAQVQQQLREKGLFILSLKATRGAAKSEVAGNRFSFRRSKVTSKDIVALTSQLAIMTKAGIDIAGAIQSLTRQCKHPALKATLELVHQDVMAGKTVSAALRNQSHVFGAAYVASVAAGEASGQAAQTGLALHERKGNAMGAARARSLLNNR